MLCVVLHFALTVLVAQICPIWQWAVNAGGTGNDYGEAIAVDSQGNQFVTGRFEYIASFGATSLTSTGEDDIFICMLDTAGNFLWAVKAGGIDWDSGFGIAVDNAGNSYVSGYFQGTSAFGATTLTSSGYKDLFVCKLDASGNFLWAIKAGGISIDQGQGLAVDSAGNCYVTGEFRDTAIFGDTTLTSSGGRDMFVCKLDSDGNFLWVVQAGGIDWDCGFGIAVDNAGYSYVSGVFQGTSTFGATTLTSSGDFDIFACKLDTNGNFLWAKKAGGASQDFGNGIVVDSDGNSYVTGFYWGTASFGATTLTSSGMNDIFVCKLDANGNFLWAVQAGDSDYDDGLGIAVDNAGNSYVSGFFQGTSIFGATSLTSSGFIDIFVCKLDANGNFLWAMQAGGNSWDEGDSIAVDSAGNSYVTGRFEDFASFGAITLTSSEVWDIFVCKLGSATPVDDPTVPELSGQSNLYPIWPNPCRQGQTATLKARIAERETASLSLYNLRGQMLSRRELAAGEHEIALESRELPLGLYFCRLATPSNVTVRKLVIIR